MKTIFLVLGAVSLCVGGCSSSVPEQQLLHSSRETLSASSASATRVSGYDHNLSTSKFRIGQGTHLELSRPDFQRWRGSLGAFAIDPTNGAASAIKDGTAPAGPYIVDVAQHNAAVRAYFVAAGIPSEQIAGVFENVLISGTSVRGQPGTTSPTVPDSINSVLTRVINGIPVVESVAWAKMTTDGGTDAEVVFWPAIDAVTVAQAVAFSQGLQDANKHASYLAGLPGSVAREVGVVIHHSDMNVHAPVTSFAVYDAVIGTDPNGAPRHFDINGKEVILPQEAPPLVSATRHR